MKKTIKKNNGDVQWYLPNSKKPFAYSTRAVSDTIAILYAEYKDMRLVRDNIHYDEDAKKICDVYIKNGFYTGLNIEY